MMNLLNMISSTSAGAGLRGVLESSSGAGEALGTAAGGLAAIPIPATLAISSDDGVLVALAALGGSFLVAITWTLVDSARRILATRAREQTKRELAAYVAEGSITPADAERILRADQRPGRETPPSST